MDSFYSFQKYPQSSIMPARAIWGQQLGCKSEDIDSPSHLHSRQNVPFHWFAECTKLHVTWQCALDKKAPLLTHLIFVRCSFRKISLAVFECRSAALSFQLYVHRDLLHLSHSLRLASFHDSWLARSHERLFSIAIKSKVLLQFECKLPYTEKRYS